MPTTDNQQQIDTAMTKEKTTMRQALVAYTSYANTIESDREREVLHDVMVRAEGFNTETVRLLAVCPMDAIDRVRELPGVQYERLPRVAGKAVPEANYLND